MPSGRGLARAGRRPAPSLVVERGVEAELVDAGRRPSPASRRCRSRGCAAQPWRSGRRRCRPRRRRRRRRRRRPRCSSATSSQAGVRGQAGHAEHAEVGRRRARPSGRPRATLRRRRAPRTRASRAVQHGVAHGEPVGARRDDLADRAAVQRPRRARTAARRTCASFIRPRMYGSTDMKRLRTRTWPVAGLGDARPRRGESRWPSARPPGGRPGGSRGRCSTCPQPTRRRARARRAVAPRARAGAGAGPRRTSRPARPAAAPAGGRRAGSAAASAGRTSR